MRIFFNEQYEQKKRYKSFKIETKPSTHKEVFSRFFKNLKKDSKILILGSGEGAFEARLFDSGFKNLYSVEYDKKIIKFNSQKKIYELDLNKITFSENIKNKFDAIVAIDIIEHVYNPQIFLLNCFKLLNNKGFLVVTTPNIHSFISRLFFFFKGYPHKFHYTVRKWEHFSPIMKKHFIFQAKEVGFKRINYFLSHNYLDTIQIRGLKSFFLWSIAIPLLSIVSLINNKLLKTVSIYYLEK